MCNSSMLKCKLRPHHTSKIPMDSKDGAVNYFYFLFKMTIATYAPSKNIVLTTLDRTFK